MNKSIDQINDRYKYELKYDADKPIFRINDSLIAKLNISFDFKGKLIKLLEKDKLILLQEKIDKLEKDIKEIKENIFNDFEYVYFLLLRMEYNYNKNKDISGAECVYNNIFKNILDNQADNCVKYEKKLLLINDNISYLLNSIYLTYNKQLYNFC